MFLCACIVKSLNKKLSLANYGILILMLTSSLVPVLYLFTKRLGRRTLVIAIRPNLQKFPFPALNAAAQRQR